MFQGIKAVVFDIDGTLYPMWKLYLRLILYVPFHMFVYIPYGIIRRKLRRSAPVADFYEYQARLYAETARTSVEKARKDLKKVCYEGIAKHFNSIKPYKNVVECIKAFKEAGLKVGVLSDFPPSQKGKMWGIRDMLDVCLGTEEAGALKPSIYPFKILCDKLGLPPEQVLYVGDNRVYDVLGAKKAGMKSAFILTGFRWLFRRNLSEADISFRDYCQFKKIVLG